MKKEIDNVIEWIQNYVFVPARGAVLGLSGGIDSAVVAALCKEALGVNMEEKSNVRLYAMPCGSNPKDLEDAQLVADHLELNLNIIDLNPSLTSMVAGQSFERSKLVYANIKARLRMTMLYAQACEHNAMVAGTGNKSELAIGYLTKYGDGGVDFEPIGDFYKTEVFEMAKVLGLPRRIIEKKPTAGLWEGQTDEDELGMNYYELDEILKKMTPDLVMNPPGDPKTQKVIELIRQSTHKRKMPPMYERDKYYGFRD
jgi:NAD+ synthase